ncbi:MAG: hypothetical protein WCQ50_18350 [Spirochaetota bacterium]
MPVSSRLSLGSAVLSTKRSPKAREISRPKTAPEERWWFPLGSITRVGEGAFRWHSVGFMPPDNHPFVFSGRVELHDGVGLLHDEDSDEGDIDEDPSESWYDRLPPFPYAHIFFDEMLDGGTSELGPWCCIHGLYGYSRAEVEMKCGSDPENEGLMGGDQ